MSGLRWRSHLPGATGQAIPGNLINTVTLGHTPAPPGLGRAPRGGWAQPAPSAHTEKEEQRAKGCQRAKGTE